MFRSIIVAALLGGAAAPLSAQTSAAPKTGQTAPVTATEHISVESIGVGTPVILIPGLATPRAVWGDIAPVLARRHRVLLVEVDGFGAAAATDANLAPGMLAGIVEEIAALIDREQLGRPAVIGHSMGGLIGMMLAERHPARVGRLMVVDALPFIGPLFGADSVEVLAPQASAIAAAAQTPPAPPAAPTAIDPGGIWSNTPEGRIRVANWTAAADRRVVARATAEVMATDLRPGLAAIAPRPFVVLRATGGGPRADAIWESAYSGSVATMIAVPDSRHFIMLDQPARFQAEVERFLTGY